ncbi:hypothetical protein ABHF91_09720 [Pseudaeromonas sp. ZJS20]
MAQSAGLVLEQVEVVPGVILGLVPTKLTGMVGDELALGVHLEPVGEDPGGNVPMCVTAVDTVGVAVEVDETGTVDAQLPLHIAIEAGCQGAQGGPLQLEALPHRVGRVVRMRACLCRLLQLLDEAAVEFG